MENQRFLCVKTKPYLSCCGVSLKISLIVIAVIDFFDGIFNFVRFTYQATCMRQGEASTMELCKVVNYFISAFSIIFAFIALKAVYLLRKKAISDYALYKQFTLVALLIIAVVYEFAELKYLSGFSIPSIVFLIFSRTLSYFITKVVWSASIQLPKTGNFVIAEDL